MGLGEVDTDMGFGDLQGQHVEEGSQATLIYCLCDLGHITFPSISLCFPLCTSSSF